MRYRELRTHVWTLWREARYGDQIDAPYRAWIISRTNERVLDAQLVHDDAAGELGVHLLHDFREQFDSTERLRFAFWWQHVMEHGFDGDNPLRHLHKPKATVPA